MSNKLFSWFQRMAWRPRHSISSIWKTLCWIQSYRRKKMAQHEKNCFLYYWTSPIYRVMFWRMQWWRNFWEFWSGTYRGIVCYFMLLSIHLLKFSSLSLFYSLACASLCASQFSFPFLFPYPFFLSLCLSLSLFSYPHSTTLFY